MVDLKTKPNGNQLARRMQLMLECVTLNDQRPTLWLFGEEEQMLVTWLMEASIHTYATFEGIPWKRIRMPSALGLLSVKKIEG